MKITVKNSGTGGWGGGGGNNARVSFGRWFAAGRTAMNYSIFFNGTTFWSAMGWDGIHDDR